MRVLGGLQSSIRAAEARKITAASPWKPPASTQGRRSGCRGPNPETSCSRQLPCCPRRYVTRENQPCAVCCDLGTCRIRTATRLGSPAASTLRPAPASLVWAASAPPPGRPRSAAPGAGGAPLGQPFLQEREPEHFEAAQSVGPGRGINPPAVDAPADLPLEPDPGARAGGWFHSASGHCASLPFPAFRWQWAPRPLFSQPSIGMPGLAYPIRPAPGSVESRTSRFSAPPLLRGSRLRANGARRSPNTDPRR